MPSRLAATATRTLPQLKGARGSSHFARSDASKLSAFGSCVNPSSIRAGNTQVFDGMLSLLGSTPVVSLNALTSRLTTLRDGPHGRPEINVKLESTNPGWSVKARPAVNMLHEAELRGDINPNTVIVESSSGNTAIAMAMVSAMKGYRFKPVVDVKMPQAKLDLLRVFGAEVELVGDPNVPPDEQDMVELKKERRATVQRLVRELGSDAYSPNQYQNPDNAGAHVLSTGPELLEQLGGEIDAIILPISTGGQLNGIGRFIKEHVPSCLLVGTEPIGSTILQKFEGSYYNAGSGLDYAPVPVEAMVADGLVDEAWAVPDDASFKTSRVLAKTTGALLGPTTGMQVFAALALALERPELKSIAVIGCDDGRAYVPDMMAAQRADELDTVEELEADLHAFNAARRSLERPPHATAVGWEQSAATAAKA